MSGAQTTSKADQRHRLQVVADYVGGAVGCGRAPASIITYLVDRFGATYTKRPSTNTLRCAGVTATCTWSEDAGLLQAWRKNATVRLMALRNQAASV